jgi:hypothetical protein
MGDSPRSFAPTTGAVDLLEEEDVLGMEVDMELGGFLELDEGFADRGFDHLRGDGKSGNELLGDFERELCQGVLRFANDVGHGAFEGFKHPALQIDQFPSLLHELVIERFLALPVPALVSGLIAGR